VGKGTVTATADIVKDKCGIEIVMNGEVTDTIEVVDGDPIEVVLYTSNEECECCEVKKDCKAKAASMWVMKSTKDGKIIAIDKKQIDDRLKNLAIRMARRKLGLRKRPD
jgi:hypothetical protein